MIAQYISDHEFAWADTTKKQAASLLGTHANPLKPPAELWQALQGLAPYSRQVAWTRISHYADWLVANGHATQNPYKAFSRKNRRLFKGSYAPERLQVTFEEAEKRIQAIPDDGARRAALRLLYGAQRWSDNATGTGHVVGKGNKVRQDFAPEHLQGASAPYHTLYRALKKVGLKPHSLRKLALTRLAQKGATAADLMAVAGWSSIATAYSYLQANQAEMIKEMMR